MFMSTKEQVIKNLGIDDIEEFQKQYDYKDMVLDQFSVSDNYKLEAPDISLEVTGTGMEAFCNLLKIPYRFGKTIPVDLLQKNVDRLKQPKPIRIVTRENKLINVVDLEKQPHFRVLNTGQLLEYFRGDKFDVKKAVVGDRGAFIDIIHKDLNHIKMAEVGDIVSFGYRIENPFTLFGTSLRSSLFAEELRCTNGMIMPKDIFSIRLSLRKDYGDEQDYFDRFKNGLDQKIGNSFSLNKLEELFADMSKTKVKNISAGKMFSTLDRLGGETFASQLLAVNIPEGLDDKEQYELMREVKKDFTNKPLVERNVTFFNVMYGLTEKAQTFGLQERLAAEQYSSVLFDLCEKQKTFSLN